MGVGVGQGVSIYEGRTSRHETSGGFGGSSDMVPPYIGFRDSGLGFSGHERSWKFSVVRRTPSTWTQAHKFRRCYSHMRACVNLSKRKLTREYNQVP